MVEKETTERRPRLKKWIEKVTKEKASNNSDRTPEAQVKNTDAVEWDWEDHVQEIADLTETICSFDCNYVEASEILQISDEVLALTKEIDTVDGMLKQGKWVIDLHDKRVEELEKKIKEDLMLTNKATMRLNEQNKQNSDLSIAIDRMNSELEFCQQEKQKVVSKVHECHLKLLQMERLHEKGKSSSIFTEVELSRSQNNVLRRRMEACKEKDAFEELTQREKKVLGFREYTAMEMKLATDDFSPTRRFHQGEDQDSVYRASMDHATVAIKRVDDGSHSPEAFLEMVQKMHNLRHRNLLRVVGFCSELRCVVFEYMAGGNLKEVLLPTRKGNRSLTLHDRIRIARDVCAALCHLHSAHPDPIVHGRLALSTVLLDPTLSAKISWPDLKNGCDTWMDVRDFGILIVSLLAEYKQKAGDVVSEELDEIATLCASECRTKSNLMSALLVRLDELNHKVGRRYDRVSTASTRTSAPGYFMCPIRQVVMKDPYTAADGFSYEKEAIEEWIGRGRDTSPITNCKLKHNFLMPNISLRYMIQDCTDFTAL